MNLAPKAKTLRYGVYGPGSGASVPFCSGGGPVPVPLPSGSSFHFRFGLVSSSPPEREIRNPSVDNHRRT